MVNGRTTKSSLARFKVRGVVVSAVADFGPSNISKTSDQGMKAVSGVEGVYGSLQGAAGAFSGRLDLAPLLPKNGRARRTVWGMSRTITAQEEDGMERPLNQTAYDLIDQSGLE